MFRSGLAAALLALTWTAAADACCLFKCLGRPTGPSYVASPVPTRMVAATSLSVTMIGGKSVSTNQVVTDVDASQDVQVVVTEHYDNNGPTDPTLTVGNPADPQYTGPVPKGNIGKGQNKAYKHNFRTYGVDNSITYTFVIPKGDLDSGSKQYFVFANTSSPVLDSPIARFQTK